MPGLPQSLRLASRVDELCYAMLAHHGYEDMPRVLVCSPQLRDALVQEIVGLERFDGGVLQRQAIMQLETEYGTIRVKADPDCPPDTLYLTHEEAS